MDLSSHAENSLDMSSVPLGPVLSPNSPGSGNLRQISCYAWSKSADDLGKLLSIDLSPKKSFQDKVAQYWNHSNSNTSTVTPADIRNICQPFPKLRTFFVPASRFDDTPSFWLVLETGPFASYTSLSLIMYF